MRSRTGFTILLLAVFVAVCLSGISVSRSTSAQSQSVPSFRERENAFRENSIGVARLEQYDYIEAANAFRRALKIDPGMKIAQINLAIALFNSQDIPAARSAAEDALKLAPEMPQTHYVLGLIARNENRSEDALAAFEKVLQNDPSDVGANFNVGQIYTEQRKYDDAIKAFRLAYDAEPYNSSAIYNLATALIRTEKREEGQKLIDQFQKLRQSGGATSFGQNYLEQGRYAEALVSTGAEQELVEPLASPPSFESIGFRSSVDRGVVNAASLFDFDNDDDLDLVAVVDSKFALVRNDQARFTDVSSSSSGLVAASGVGVVGIVTGDYDNDSQKDILFFGRGRPGLLRGDGKGGFSNVSGKLPLLSGPFASGAFVDADHDGDLDIVLGGGGTARATVHNRLIRNNGDGTFTDVSPTAKIDSGSPVVAVIPTDFDNRRDVDLLVVSYNQRPNLFRNLRNGTFRDVAEDVGLVTKDKWTSAAIGDFNKDTFVDFFFGRQGRPGIFAVSNGKGSFVLQDAPPGTENAYSAQFIDFDNDGLLDLITAGPNGIVTLRNAGGRWDSVRSEIKGIGPANGFAPTSRIVSGDIDRDGDIDLVIAGNRGPLSFLRSSSPAANRSTVVSLKGQVSNRDGVGAKIDLRAGSLSQRLETYSASPMPAPSEVHFGLGRREAADTVRVLWPSGVIQAELNLPLTTGTLSANRPVAIQELNRKASSCPYLYTWNGKEFEFITDFLGGGEMGNWQARGIYHYPDSDEVVRISSDKLRPKNGRYEIRITNELEEVLFLDHLKLFAVEHPEGSEIYPNEGLGIPTSGQRIIYTTAGEHPPVSAIDGDGRDVAERIKSIDKRFYDSFKSLGIRGYADTHTLTLNLDDRKGYNGRTLLLLTGWTDYAFSSDNVAASQSGKELFFPKLQVRNKRGEWETVIDSIGISVGRPQTVVVDLSGKFLTGSREVRIVTNVKTYWDKIAVDTSDQTTVSSNELSGMRADLRERGFSDEQLFAGMIVPTYEHVVKDARWKYFSGRFTRFGDVKPLLDDVDDVFVISRTGDELVLSFEVPPEPRPGRKLTFLLFADGYSKEMDINSGSPDTVLPLPFKGMTKYPYSSTERFPMTAEKQRLYDLYTTRTVMRPLPGVDASLLR